MKIEKVQQFCWNLKHEFIKELNYSYNFNLKAKNTRSLLNHTETMLKRDEKLLKCVIHFGGNVWESFN